MNGKMEGQVPSFQTIFDAQSSFQKEVTGVQTPSDNTKWFQYHMTAMTEELGEILRADKRWKTHRNVAYNPENKLEEISDMFITAINIALFSGFSAQELADSILNKIGENTQKFRKG